MCRKKVLQKKLSKPSKKCLHPLQQYNIYKYIYLMLIVLYFLVYYHWSLNRVEFSVSRNRKRTSADDKFLTRQLTVHETWVYSQWDAHVVTIIAPAPSAASDRRPPRLASSEVAWKPGNKTLTPPYRRRAMPSPSRSSQRNNERGLNAYIVVVPYTPGHQRRRVLSVVTKSYATHTRADV